MIINFSFVENIMACLGVLCVHVNFLILSIITLLCTGLPFVLPMSSDKIDNK